MDQFSSPGAPCDDRRVNVEAARQLAHDYLAVSLPSRWLHTQQVAAQAAELADALGLPDSPLVCAAWLHDIAYAPELTNCGFHPIDGARFLRRLGWPADVCTLVAHHSHAVVEAERRGLGDALHVEFVDEPGPARDALWMCDATTGPNGERFTFEERVAEIVQRYGPGSLVAESMLAIRPHIQEAITRTEERLDRVTTQVQPM